MRGLPLTRHHIPRPAPSGPVVPLPTFLIARQPDGSMKVRELPPDESGQSLMARLRLDARFSCVWLAKAFQGATGAAE